MKSEPLYATRTCEVEGCDREYSARGMCVKHYSRWHNRQKSIAEGRAARVPNKDENGNPIPCDFPGCTRLRSTSGLCSGHYSQRLKGQELRPLKFTLQCPVGWCDKPMRYDAEVCRIHSALRKKYGLTVKELLDLYAPGKCANPYCDNTEPLDVDHDHSCCEMRGSCGKCVRGLLCRDCNHTLGRVHDSPQKLRGLIEYLESWEARRP